MPSVKHRLVIGHILADPSISLYKAMTLAGYAHSTAIAPSKNLLRQPGFMELVEEYLPDNMLLGALRDDIKSKPGKRTKELELAFRVKGKMKLDEAPAGNTYNTFIQSNTINPNAPDAKTLVDTTLEMLMNQTKRKVIDQP